MIKELVKRFCFVLVVLVGSAMALQGQKVYFVDGFHGGIYGHYPPLYTAFINEMLDKHPDWSISLELEPETWDSVQRIEPGNYAAFRNYLQDQSDKGRVEYVNPSYGQSYLYNINGESIIRQFTYGIRKMKQHFPDLVYTTYSSEEPCFTSALPQVLKSFGFKYASLKNPNTCWGGYTKAYGGEILNWVGPDGSKLLTVPRYASEALDPKSTWQTTASTNSPAFINTALAAGIRNPVGMCLQDAGWKFGPWLRRESRTDKSIYTTWRNYITNVADKTRPDNWRLSQEDIQVSLVWGAQVLQQIARQVRFSENRITRAEKLSAMASLLRGTTYPHAAFDEGWRELLLAQHHDCWIVPYNGKRNNTWIDKVERWTSDANRLADSVSVNSWASLNNKSITDAPASAFRVFNPNAARYDGLITVDLPPASIGKEFSVSSSAGPLSYQLDGNKLSFRIDAPGTGISTYVLKMSAASTQPARKTASLITRNTGGEVVLETDLYRMVFDPAKGGAMVSLTGKKLGGKQFVDTASGAGFNEMKGYFFKDSSFLSSAALPATITTVSDGPEMAAIKIEGRIGQHPFTQLVKVTKTGKLIDVDLKINWIGNPGIGNDYKQTGGYKAEDYRKAFYDDSQKLRTMFPLGLKGQKLSKNAPFDVTESRLGNTFFETWDSIKNNIILNWVDVTDEKGQYGFALFTDHTTNYSHGDGNALGLTTQYSGVGLWGMNYRITGPTSMHYAFYPHAGDWQQSSVWQQNIAWNNPVEIALVNETVAKPALQLVSVDNEKLEITSIEMDGNDLLVRCFNPSTRAATAKLTLLKKANNITSVELDGRVKKKYKVVSSVNGSSANLLLPAFGFETIRFSGIKK